MQKTQAEYHDGVSSNVVSVDITFSDDGSIIISGDGVSKICLLDDVSFSPRLGNIPRVITLADNASCHVADNDLIDAFLKMHNQGGSSSVIHLLESHIVYVLAAVLFTVFFSWGMVVHGVPYLSKQIALSLPADVDRMLGQGTLETMDKIIFTESKVNLNAKENLVLRFEKMKNSIDGAQGYKLLFRHGNKIGANAFALPSGIIVVTDELVELSDNDDEVVAVLAHEIGHLEYRHSVRMVLQDSAIAVLVSTITGDPFSTSSLVVALPTILANANYSRDFEREADDYTYQYMTENNMDLTSFATILQKITEQDEDTESGIADYISSHPATGERTKRFK